MNINLTIPVYNEEKVLTTNINKLVSFLTEKIKEDNWQIIIANNASTDNTAKLAEQLASQNSKIKTFNLDIKGRGHALKYSWLNFPADILAYCDVDLATDINKLPELFSLIKNDCDLAIGSRYLPDSASCRKFKRLIISKGYIFLVKIFFKTKLTDFQCGFKALSQRLASIIVPKLKDGGWFFDTELILLAGNDANHNFIIKELPVNWQENKNSKVKFFISIIKFIKNLIVFKLNN